MAVQAKSSKPPKSVTPRQPWVEAFRAGTHTDAKGVEHEYSDADIDTIATKVNAQVAGGFLPPIVLGHPRMDSPRQGAIVEAVASGASPRRLYVRADELVPEFAEAVQAGEYKYCSPAFYADLGLRHLGILGGANPSVKGMAPLEFGEGMFAEVDAGLTADDVLQFMEPLEQMSMIGSAFLRISWRVQSLGTLFANLRDQLIATGGSVEAADKIYPSYLIESLTGFDLSDVANTLTQPEGPGYSEPTAPTGGTPLPLADGSGSSGGQGGDPETIRLREELRRRDEEASLRAFSDRLDGMSREGRLTPGQRTAVEGLFKQVSESVEGVMYAEGDPAFATLDSLLASYTKQVEFGEHHQELPSTVHPLVADASRRSKV